jgi:hypothetical protein
MNTLHSPLAAAFVALVLSGCAAPTSEETTEGAAAVSSSDLVAEEVGVASPSEVDATGVDEWQVRIVRRADDLAVAAVGLRAGTEVREVLVGASRAPGGVTVTLAGGDGLSEAVRLALASDMQHLASAARATGEPPPLGGNLAARSLASDDAIAACLRKRIEWSLAIAATALSAGATLTICTSAPLSAGATTPLCLAFGALTLTSSRLSRRVGEVASVCSGG